MYRLFYRTVYTTRNSSVNICESCVLLAKCSKSPTPAFRVANGVGVRALGTSSVRLCEKKNDVASSNEDDKTAADREDDPSGTPALVVLTTEDDGKGVQMVRQSDEPAVLKTDDGRTTQQLREVEIEPVVETNQIKTSLAKSSKESLLDLLGTMKVEVTTKRKLRNLKVNQSYKPTPMQKPAAMESTISMFQQATVEASSQSETLDPELLAAASAAASTLPNRGQAESELLRQLRQRKAVADAQMKGDMNLGVIIADMKVGKNANRMNTRPTNQIQFDDDGRGYTRDSGITAELSGVQRRRNLFSGKRLNIFSPATEEGAVSTVARPTLWDMDFANRLSQSTNQMPRNGLEEMIQWTKEGKLRQYPINNEAGLDEEASVSFAEHIFLEKHLEEGFPRQGPVRHFMELVVAGLSRNPYLTVQQKKEHISWFRDYFQQKKEVLKEAQLD